VRDLLRGQVPLEAFPGASPFERAQRSAFGLWTAVGAEQTEARVAGPAYFDQGATAHPSARVGESVYVGARSSLGQGARLNRVVVMEDTRVAENEELHEVIAWGTHRIPAPLDQG